MAEQNRFEGLMSGLNTETTEEKPTEKPKTKKARRKSRTSKQATPTSRAKGEPKMRRNRGEDTLAKSKDPDYEKGTYYLPKVLTHDMRVYAVTRKMEMSELVQQAVSAYLESHSPKN